MSYTTVATQLMERDYRILRGLFESRVMTLLHIAVLYFDKSIGAARKRVWKLKNAGLVGERRRARPYDPSILYLTRQGFERLSREQRILDYPSIGWPTMEKRTSVSPLTLQHELDVMTAKAALCSAIHGTSTHKVAEFSTWPRLFAFPSKTVSAHGYSSKVWIKPDAFIRVREADEHGFDANEHLFYLEVDRSTEPQGRLQSKAGAYAEHYRSGGLARRFGAPAAAYEEYPFRVLIVCRTAERCNNIAVSMLTRTPPILTMVWLTTLDDLCGNPLGPIWIRPTDYREATRGTPFDPYPPPARDGYKRQLNREEHVCSKVSRRALFS
jgi:hypothetical protein